MSNSLSESFPTPASSHPRRGLAAPAWLTVRCPRLALLAALLSVPGMAAAQDSWALCGPLAVPAGGQSLPASELPAFLAAPELTGGEIRIDADEVQAHTETSTVFEGDVVVRQNERRLEGERAEYQRPTETVRLSGGIRYYTPSFYLQGDEAFMALDSDSGWVTEGRFLFPEAHAHGDADRVTFVDAQRTELEGATYTTCDPSRVDWQLKASHIRLDEAANTGEAFGTSVWFKGVPFLYLPYMNFALSGRKSGLLSPSYGSSGVNGTELQIPYYWNIAPNRDATLTPRWLSRRGTVLQGEFRYLERWGAGQVNANYLANDQLVGEERYFIDMEHRWQPAPGWAASLVYREVSDDRYFNDLERSVGSTSQSYLERNATVSYSAGTWNARARTQDFQVLTGLPPYSRAPELDFQASLPVGGAADYDIRAEAVRFVHEDADKVQGTRLDVEPAVSLPMEGAAWFLTPRLSVRHTRYELDQAGANPAAPSRTLPVTSMDGGLFFERELTAGQRPLLQTLEPRLFYLYVPYENQSDLPRFDASDLTFSFASLFRRERFGGADRVGDANQLTAAVTTRFLDAESGAEYGRASAGQIFYFADRRVQLADEPVENEGRSNYVGELAFSPNRRTELTASAQWDPERGNKTELASVGMRYADGPDKVVSGAYRYRASSLEQADVALFWPLHRRWHFIGRWWHDLKEDRTFERVAGLRYETCCWSLQTVARTRPYQTTDGSFKQEDSFLITFNLKGLATIGKRLEDSLERGVLGYGIR